jgi:hypothetical protein
VNPNFADVFHQPSDDYYKLLGDAQAAEAKSTMCEKASWSDCVILWEDFNKTDFF